MSHSQQRIKNKEEKKRFCLKARMINVNNSSHRSSSSSRASVSTSVISARATVATGATLATGTALAELLSSFLFLILLDLLFSHRDVAAVVFSPGTELLDGQARNVSQLLGASSSLLLDDAGRLQLLVLTSPGDGPLDLMGLGLVEVKGHGLLANVEFLRAISGDVDNPLSRVDLVLAEVAITGSDNHFTSVSLFEEN